MTNLRTPGVYIREVEVKPPPRLRMDIAGFVGQAERGPLNQPQAIRSWGEYRDIFGGFTGYSYLPYCVFTFFANGGEKCYVVRVAPENAATAKLVLYSEYSEKGKNNEAARLIQIEAINEGAWGNDIEVVAESASTDDLVLTVLEEKLEVGKKTLPEEKLEAGRSSISEEEPESKNVPAYFRSVLGLLDGGTACAGKGDRVKLIHPSNPIQQEQVVISNIDFEEKQVEFETNVSEEFPAGSLVLGKGFKLTFRYLRNGQFIRGEVFDNLSLNPSHERYFVRVINGDPEETDYIKRLKAGNSILVRVRDSCVGNAQPYARITEKRENLSEGNDGDRTSVKASNFTGYKGGNYSGKDDRDANKRYTEKLFGLAAFEAVEEIGTVAIPDLIIPDFYDDNTERHRKIPEQEIIFASRPKAIPKLENLKIGQAGLLFHCLKMRERFAILDSPQGSEIGRGENRIEEWSSNYQLLSSTKYGALYYPWVKQKMADFDGRELFIPPCGHIAGIYSRTEQERGVGKSPANEILRGAIEFEFCLSDEQQGLLNPKGINCLRVFPGRGLRVWGARTLSLDTMSMYVNVRRVTLAIIKNILVNLRWTVFEPNDSSLWNKITANLTLFFNRLFESGALAGAIPEDAFFVKCDEETNPPEIVDAGQVITEIGFAPARPAEFILVTIKRTPGALSITEL